MQKSIPGIYRDGKIELLEPTLEPEGTTAWKCFGLRDRVAPLVGIDPHRRYISIWTDPARQCPGVTTSRAPGQFG